MARPDRIGHCYTTVFHQSSADILERVRKIMSADPSAHARASGALEAFVQSLVPLTIAERECVECGEVLPTAYWEGTDAHAGVIRTTTSAICDECFELKGGRLEARA